MAVSVKALPTLEIEQPRLIWSGLSKLASLRGRPFDVMPDGQRFLAIKEDPFAPEKRLELRLVINWIEELKTKLEKRE